MNTTAIGDLFENKVLSILEKLEEEGNLFGFQKGVLEICPKMKIYSNETKKSVIVDIGIRAKKEYAQINFLIIIECKDIKDKVLDIGDMREFTHKVKELKANKGILFTTTSLSRSVIELAKFNEIAIVRVNRDTNDYSWIQRRTPTPIVKNIFKSEFTISVLESKKFPIPFVEYVIVDKVECTANLLDYLAKSPDEVLSEKTEKAGFSNSIVRKRNKKGITDIVQLVLNKYQYQAGYVDVEKIAVSEGFVIQYQDYIGEDWNGNQSIGSINFDDRTINILTSIKGHYQRERFILAHELGHHFLNHSEYIQKDKYSENTRLLNNEGIEVRFIDIQIMEWQANFFASCILLPIPQITMSMNELLHKYDIRDRGFGRLYVDQQKENRETFNIILQQISSEYRVSKKAVEIRLKDLDYLKIESSSRHINSVLSEINNLL